MKQTLCFIVALLCFSNVLATPVYYTFEGEAFATFDYGGGYLVENGTELNYIVNIDTEADGFMIAYSTNNLTTPYGGYYAELITDTYWTSDFHSTYTQSYGTGTRLKIDDYETGVEFSIVSGNNVTEWVVGEKYVGLNKRF